MKRRLRKTSATLFLFVYKFINGGIRQILYSTWGFVSECKHQPTCSEYMSQQIAESGWRGVGRGLKQLINCR